jgi:MraZ protein
LLVPTEKWSVILEPLQKSSFFDRNIRDTLRFLVGSSYTIDTDKQGRIVVPAMLREYSKIAHTQNDSSEVVFVGLVNWAEIWEKSLWEQRLAYVEDNADEIAQELKMLQGESTK